MICTKFNALCSRIQNTDRLDLRGLNPSKEEMQKAKNWVISQKNLDQEIVHEIGDKFLESLNKEQGRGR